MPLFCRSKSSLDFCLGRHRRRTTPRRWVLYNRVRQKTNTSAHLFVDSKIQSSVVCWYITYKRPFESRKKGVKVLLKSYPKGYIHWAMSRSAYLLKEANNGHGKFPFPNRRHRRRHAFTPTLSEVIFRTKFLSKCLKITHDNAIQNWIARVYLNFSKTDGDMIKKDFKLRFCTWEVGKLPPQVYHPFPPTAARKSQLAKSSHDPF